MNNPGIIPLCSIEITTNLINVEMDPVEDLEGMLSLGLEFIFDYHGGGGSGKAFVQTSLDQGSTWADVASFIFTTASKSSMFNVSALTPKLTPYTPTNKSLADDTAVDSVLGDRLRVCVSSTGAVYGATTTLTIRGVAR